MINKFVAEDVVAEDMVPEDMVPEDLVPEDMVPEKLVPHSGKMSLLTEILSGTEDQLSAIARVDEDNPFLMEGGVPGWLGIEYMAQSIAAWAGCRALKAREPVKVGFLVGTRDYECSTGSFPIGTEIEITVQRVIFAENGLSVFDCNLTTDLAWAKASLKVFQPADVSRFLEEEA